MKTAGGQEDGIPPWRQVGVVSLNQSAGHGGLSAVNYIPGATFTYLEAEGLKTCGSLEDVRGAFDTQGYQAPIHLGLALCWF